MDKKNLENLYFEDYLLTLSSLERDTLKTLARTFWYGIFSLGIILFLIGLNQSLFSTRPILSLILERSFFYALFWLGVFLLLYFFHHLYKTRKPRLSLKEIDLQEELKTKRINSAYFLEPLAKDFIMEVFDKSRSELIKIDFVIFESLLETPFFKNVLEHLETKLENIKNRFEQAKGNIKKYKSIDELLADLNEIMINAVNSAIELDDEAIDLVHLMVVVLKREHKFFEDIFTGENIDFEDVKHVLFYNKLRQKYSYLIQRAKPRRIKHRYMDLAMTAKPTYYLDQFSHDLTDLARYGVIGFMIGHKEETEELINILVLDAKNNALLMGPTGIGKTTIIENLAWRVFRGLVPSKLQDKRVVALDTGAILSGLRTPGELQERLNKIRDEILNAKNLILVIPDLHDLMRATSMQAASLSSFFGSIFEMTDFPLVATTDEKNYHLYIEPDSEVANAFNQLKVREISPEEALYLVMIEAFKIEAKKNALISYYALKEVVEVAIKYIHNQPLPGKAVSLLNEAVENALSQGKRFITKELVRETFTKRTGIPLAQAKFEEKKILLELENILHQRMVDQEQAVKAVAEALREARTGLGREKGPIGTFLFVGPTGVGKTEMAKTLASYYFKGEEKMLRFDMSEYQTNDAIYRLIGYRGQGGFMTEAVKQNPFSLILLDEFEKANRDVLNLFLQVFDDGRLTDELGNVVDFTNTIIICTSNAHSVLIKEELEKGRSIQEIRDLMKQRLTDYFKPELINRFDEIVVFKPLDIEDIRKIAFLQLGRLFWQLENDKGFKFKITDRALGKIVKVGFDPVYGARPLRQAIRKKIKNLISLLILQDKLERGNHYLLDAEEDKGFFVIDENTKNILKLDS